jgi:tol-pal system protein YbgF
MKKAFLISALVSLFLCLASAPALAVSKEILQLQTQVEILTQQIQGMQRSFDERMGVMKSLVEQSTDATNKATASLSTSLADLQALIKKQQADTGTHADQLSGQIQALNDSIDELKVRLGKVSKQLEDLQSSQQTLTAQAAQVVQQQQAPPPDVLYNNALRDYNAAKNDLASQEFLDYLKFYPNTDLAGNASFYLAEIEYRGGSYEQAVKDYDKVLENFPGGNKGAAAHLKKGMALVQLGKKDEGIAEFQTLLQRFPRSPEATQAKDQLEKLGVSTKPTRRSR